MDMNHQVIGSFSTAALELHSKDKVIIVTSERIRLRIEWIGFEGRTVKFHLFIK
jgi:hypothetical protein